MRKYGRTDQNHTAIVDALRAVGCSVQSIASIGGGCPDLVVGRRGTTYLLELKDGTKPLYERRLTPDEFTWHMAWRGQVAVVESVADALAVVGGGLDLWT